MTDFKKLIENATRRRCTDHVPRIFMELQDADRQERSFNKGASVPNELLLKAINALEELRDLMEDVHQRNYKPDSFTNQFANKTLAEIKQRLEDGL